MQTFLLILIVFLLLIPVYLLIGFGVLRELLLVDDDGSYVQLTEGLRNMDLETWFVLFVWPWFAKMVYDELYGGR